MKFQEKVTNFNAEYGVKHNPIIRVLDIVSELGELSKEFLKGTGYELGEIDTTKDIEIELGDIFYSLISLANELDLNLENCLNLALEKYSNRYELHGDLSSFK
ncbi:MAG: MazG nucleotide pyrophosphohydrolase domain-containing protein [Candidatus Kariarchaeaceae archaeon]|jgi:NTP pyrophosphatase (non-canonical NTP hydrolase)